MADEDEQWLYGTGDDEGSSAIKEDITVSEKPVENEAEVKTGGGNINGEQVEAPDDSTHQIEVTEGNEPEIDASENKAIEEGDEEDDDEDSDEDNVSVVIGDINKAAPTYSNLNVHKRGGLVPGGKAVGSKFSVDDFEALGTINGVSAVDFNIESVEDKPWRKPGADITDYFNYGFNEDTWKAYLDRHRRIRLNESGAGLPTSAMTKDQVSTVNTASNASTKRPNWETGQIHVIGASLASRRLEENGGQENLMMSAPGPPADFRGIAPPTPGMGYPPGYPPPEYQYGAPPPPEYIPDYAGWRGNWPPPNAPIPSQPPRRYEEGMEDYERDRERRERDRERDRRSETHEPIAAPGTSPPREKERERDEKRDRHRRSRSRERSRGRSRSRSPSHKKHKKKSKKSDRSDRKKQRSDESD